VLYSSQSNWIDILISLKNDNSEKRRFIITYESDTDHFIACAEAFGSLSILDAQSTDLPFALATRSYSDGVYATDQQMASLNTRREIFAKAILASLASVVSLAPALAATTTSYTTNATTGGTTGQQTPYITSGVTTLGVDNYTKNDTRADQVDDSRNDPTQDTRSDP
jgi:hypothetical protein